MIATARLLAFSKNLLAEVNRKIHTMVARSPARAFRRLNEPGKDPSNQPLFIDDFAESLCEIGLLVEFGSRIRVIGEESFQLYPELRDLTNCEHVVALVDVVDGTDLLLRGLSNWCSALVLFSPPRKTILASVVADHEGNIFFASEVEECAFYQPRGSKTPLPLTNASRPENLEEAVKRFLMRSTSGPSRNRSLSDAAIAFYGQKPTSFLSTHRGGFSLALRSLAEQLQEKVKPTPKMRIYNLGGIPMMLKVANGTLDAVFDLTGPKPHDMVAGAHIALKAGAVLGDIAGNLFAEAELATSLLTPDSDGPAYILAATEELYKELQAALSN